MSGLTKWSSVLLFFVLLLLIFPAEVYAYLDPGAGSYITQVLIASLLGISLGTKMYWTKIKGLFARVFSKKKDPKNDTEEKKTS